MSMLLAGVKYLLFGVFCSFIRNLNALPSGGERWNNPCGITAQTANNYNLSTIPTQPHLDIITSMLIRIREGQLLSSDYQEKIAKDRIQNTKYRALLDTLNHQGFPVVNVITEQETQNSLKNVTKTHLESYRILSVAAVFIEQMKYDEEIYEQKQNSKDIETLESKVFHVLCYIDQAIRTFGVNIDYINRDIMQMALRIILSTMERHSRDYITVKDTTRVLNNLIVKYTAIYNHLSPN